MCAMPVNQQILEKLQMLDDTARQRVLDFLEYELQVGALQNHEFAMWLKQTGSLLEELHLKYGKDYYLGVNDLINEIREESS